MKAKTSSTETTEVSMLRSEIELLMSDRQALLHLAGAAAKFVEKVNIEKLPLSVIPLADAVAESVNDLSEDTLREALLSIKKKR
jgi:hypothetical protein